MNHDHVYDDDDKLRGICWGLEVLELTSSFAVSVEAKEGRHEERGGISGSLVILIQWLDMT